MMTLAPSRSAKSISKRSKLTTCTSLPIPSISRRTISIRSSTENMGDLDGLVVTPMTSRSTSFAPRRMMSMCPSVIGSKVPG